MHLETPWEYDGIFKDDPTWWPMIEEIERRRDRQKAPASKFRVLLFTEEAREEFKRILKKFKSKKRYADMMIAAMAMTCHHVVVTRNTKHFADLLPPHQLANWIAEPPR